MTRYKTQHFMLNAELSEIKAGLSIIVDTDPAWGINNYIHFPRCVERHSKKTAASAETQRLDTLGSLRLPCRAYHRS